MDVDGPDGRRGRRNDWRIALATAVVVSVVVGITAQDIGFTRDEGYYFKAAELYAGWWRELVSSPLTALSPAGINAHLGYNPEHPFLMKGLFGLARAIQTGLGLDVMGHNAMRLPAWIVSGLAAATVFGLARAVRLSRVGAVVAALVFVSLPHVFWHMHVACFDVAVTAAHAGLVLAWLTLRHTTKGALLIGVIFGVCAAAKHNVLPVPALFVLHWALCEAGDRVTAARPAMTTATTATTAVTTAGFTMPVGFFSLALVGPLVYVVLWPWLWPDVVGRFGAYVAFHLHHEHYPIMLFGELLAAPPFPWSFPLVMWGVTIPLPVLVVMAAGGALSCTQSARFLWNRFRGRSVAGGAVVPLGDVARAETGATALLLLLNAAFPVFLIALPSTPIFGGTKHWMNALPFAIVLGVWAVEEALARLGRRHVVVVAAVGLAMAVPGLLQTARVGTNGLSAYNDVAGFTRGAANLGLQRTFWGYEIRPLLPRINSEAPRGARLHGGDVNQDSHTRMVADGLLRDDIRFHPGVRGADVAHVEPQGEFKQQQLDIWNEWGRMAPAGIVDVEGVPLSTVTFRP